MVKPEAPAVPRQRILDSAKGLFARHGFDSVTTRDIVKQAKANISLIKYHFGSKRDLYIACLSESADRTHRIASSVLVDFKDEAEFTLRLRIYSEQIFEERMRDYDAFRLLKREQEAGSEVFDEMFEKTYSRAFNCVVSYFKRAQELKLIDNARNAHQLANIFLGLIERELFVEHSRVKVFGASLKTQEVRKWTAEQIVDLICYGCLSSSRRSSS